MFNKLFFKGLLFTSIAGFFYACNPAQPTPPNIIIVMTDDQGYGDVGFHGNPYAKTPFLDQFSEKALELTNFHVGTTCTPTRAGLMSGRNCNRVGSWHTIAGASILNEDEETMAEVFQRNGYRTGMFGKWHLGDNYPYRPQDRGFDEAFYHGGGGVQQTPDYWGNDYFDDTYFRNGKPEKAEGYCTDVWFSEVMQFIGSRGGNPFFVYLTPNAAHGPFNVPEEYLAMYEDTGLLPYQKRFYGMLTNLDDNFKGLIAFLEEKKLLENTIVIYTTDNGTAGGIMRDRESGKMVGYNPLRGTKGNHYDGGHRVPFLIHWPQGLTGNTKSDALVSHVDLLPTLASLTGLNYSPPSNLDGSDMSAAIKGNDGDTTRMLIVDTQRIQWPEKYRNPCVMQGPWRLVNHEELYHTGKDLAQENDLAGQYPDRVRSMQEFYDQWWEKAEKDMKFSEIHLGNKSENPVRISMHDMHPDSSGGIAWNQVHIRQGQTDTRGFYKIYVEQEGEYQFALARWPEESGLTLEAGTGGVEELPFMNGLPEGRALAFSTAFVSAGGQSDSVIVTGDQPATVIKLRLTRGSHDLRSWFKTEDGTYFPAYYTYVSTN